MRTDKAVADRPAGQRRRSALVGIAGSFNAFSLSLYNLKAFAGADPGLRAAWDIPVIQHPLINVTQRHDQVPALAERVLALEPDLVGFSCYMWNVEALRELGAVLIERRPGLRVLFGGPEMATDYVTEGTFDDFPMHFCASGEGERTFAELLRHLAFGAPALAKIDGLAFRDDLRAPFAVNRKRAPFKSLAEIPSPFLSGMVDDEVLHRRKVEANIETQRGCNLRCSYCIYHKDMARVSYSSARRAIDEVRYVIDKGVKRIRFVDANFSSDLDHAKAIMRGLIAERFETKLMFELIPGFIDDELAALFGAFNALHEWNEMTLGIGVQTINPAVLKRVRRSIKKERFEKTFDLLQKNDVYAKIDLIIGLPGEDIASIERTLEYMIERLRYGRAHLLCCHVMRGLPGTELLEMAKADGMVFSSRYEPHELRESPILPRADMLKCLRRTAVVFRLINHAGWADREFISGRTSADVGIRESFFAARERLGITNVALVDRIVDGLMEELAGSGSWFAEPDFPYAETWWWNTSRLEVKNDWLIGFLRGLEPAARPRGAAAVPMMGSSPLTP